MNGKRVELGTRQSKNTSAPERAIVSQQVVACLTGEVGKHQIKGMNYERRNKDKIVKENGSR